LCHLDHGASEQVKYGEFITAYICPRCLCVIEFSTSTFLTLKVDLLPESVFGGFSRVVPRILDMEWPPIAQSIEHITAHLGNIAKSSNKLHSEAGVAKTDKKRT
jgi:hypothetical protein